MNFRLIVGDFVLLRRGGREFLCFGRGTGNGEQTMEGGEMIF